MKKTFIHLFFLVIFTGAFLFSCSATNTNSKAEEIAKNFYTNLQKKNYDAAITLCSVNAFETDTRTDWRNAFERNAGLLGELISYTKTNGLDISTSVENGTLVTLKYIVQWQYGKSQDSLVLEKQKDGNMKIYRYTWLHINAKYFTEMDNSEKAANLYMAAVEAGNYDAALALCTEAALKATPKEDWVAFLNKANDKLGSITNYTVVKDSTTYDIAANGDAGKGNYYDVIIQTERNGSKVMEKIVFFQKDYNTPVKLSAHLFL